MGFTAAVAAQNRPSQPVSKAIQRGSSDTHSQNVLPRRRVLEQAERSIFVFQSSSKGLIVPVEITAEDRLATKLDYVEALVKLDERPAARLAQHRLADGSQFILHQHELAGLPGLSLDGSDSDGPIWLRIERLQRTAPPQPEERCSPWIEVSNDPAKPPAIKDVLHRRVTEGEKDKLLDTGEVRPEDVAPALKGATKDEPPGAYFDVMLRLEDRAEIRTVLEDYCTTVWIPWAETEKPRRRSIAVYQGLFEIAQRLLQSGGQESAELIWGLGLARWTRPEEAIDLPLLERQVEIEIADQKGAAITTSALRANGKPSDRASRPILDMSTFLFARRAFAPSKAGAHDVSLVDWDAIVRVSQTGVLLGMRMALDMMVGKGALSIVNISSIWAQVGGTGQVAYHASKGAVINMTRNVAVTYAKERVRANVILPGLIDTDMVRVQKPEMNAATLALTPMGRIGLPEEIAAGVLFLASDESSFISGAVLAIDGGFTAQ